MTREEIETKILSILEKDFEIKSPGMDDDLREKHEFDSIDALELLGDIEDMLGVSLSRDDKKLAMDIRTINQICDYVALMVEKNSL